MISLEEALGLISHAKIVPVVESRPLDEAIGCVLAEDLIADRDSPPFNRSMMDGFALKRELLRYHPGQSFPVAGRILAGEPAPAHTPDGAVVRIMTGAPVPPGLDLVIPLEQSVVESTSSDSGIGTRVSFPINGDLPAAFANITLQGTDCRAKSTLLKKGCSISPATIGAIAATGARQVRVFAPPRVGILTTGTELVDIAASPLPHQIRDSNGWVLRSFLQGLGIRPEMRLCVRDRLADLEAAISDLLQNDVLVLTGAVSAGDTDFVPELLAAAGVEQVFHGVSIKPGKPIWFGRGPRGPVFGLPGNPFAVQCAFRTFVQPLLFRYLGRESAVFRLPLSLKRECRPGARAEFFPVSMGSTENGPILIPLHHNGSGDILAAAGSDGIALQEEGRSVIHPGETVQFFPWGIWDAGGFSRNNAIEEQLNRLTHNGGRL